MTKETTTLNVEKVVADILGVIEKDREKEIVSRRFGLYDRKETLEQIGELLGITRERVRQLEKAVVTKLKDRASKGEVPHINDIQDNFLAILDKGGQASRISDLSAKLTDDNSRIDQSRVSFLTKLCPKLSVLDENDFYFQSTANGSKYSEKQLKSAVETVVKAVKEIGEPVTIDKVAVAAKKGSDSEVEALASLSKQLATLNGRWGLIRWPMVNPKNIRDKIYVILFEAGKHMHFSEIAAEIKKSDFKRKDVTTQAIHNELIKDNRFVLVGRGIYALKEWGYKKGTVADVITDVLKKAGEPLHRDEIVKRVLKDRYVKETTILLNLQGKPQFKRTAKATYTLAEA
jgi:hypothetical protein